MKVNLTPINEFKYNQISNHKFQFLLLGEKNQALHSPFMCKDYLQDIFYCEYTGKSAGIYGIEWKPGMLNVNVDKFRMALLGGQENLHARIEHLEAFLNAFEDMQDIPLSKIYKGQKKEIIVVEFSKKWTENGPILSTFTTLIRISGGYKKGENILVYLKNIIKFRKENPSYHTLTDSPYPKYMSPEIRRLESYIGKLAAFYAGKKVKHDWADFSNILSVHNTGIQEYGKYPTVALD